jgi:hypothetical protein
MASHPHLYRHAQQPVFARSPRSRTHPSRGPRRCELPFLTRPIAAALALRGAVTAILDGSPARRRGIQLEKLDEFLKMADRPEPVEARMTGEPRVMLPTHRDPMQPASARSQRHRSSRHNLAYASPKRPVRDERGRYEQERTQHSSPSSEPGSPRWRSDPARTAMSATTQRGGLGAWAWRRPGR